MVTNEFLVPGGCTVMFFAQVWQFRDREHRMRGVLMIVSASVVEHQATATLQFAPEPSGSTTCWALHRSNNLAACPTRAITTQTCQR